MTDEKQVMFEASQLIKDKLIDELAQQGHTLTGALEQSIEAYISEEDENRVVLQGTALFYAKILEDGVEPSRIPYDPGSGAPHSQYIEGLQRYAMLRFHVNEQQALKIAFAIATKQKTEGMPTVDSYQYAPSGQRRFFIELSDGAVADQVNKVMEDGLDEIIDYEYRKTKSETI